MPAPADYQPLSQQEVKTLRDLFLRATGGVELLAPDPQSPANWLGEMAAASQPHVNTILKRIASMGQRAREVFVYDPRKPQP